MFELDGYIESAIKLAIENAEHFGPKLATMLVGEASGVVVKKYINEPKEDSWKVYCDGTPIGRYHG